MQTGAVEGHNVNRLAVSAHVTVKLRSVKRMQ